MIYSAAQRRKHIRELQQYLQTVSMVCGRIPMVIPDGIFGTETAAAVRAFQREFGLPENGTADSATWNTLVRVYRGYLNSAPRSYSIFPSSTYILREGDSGLLVHIVQAMLSDLSGSFDNLSALGVDGVFGRKTAEAVRTFQKMTGLNQSGAVNSPTWNMLSLVSSHHNHTNR